MSQASEHEQDFLSLQHLTKQHCHAANLLHPDPHHEPSLEVLHHHGSSYWSLRHAVNIREASSYIYKVE
jgi:hypothetical protein